MDDTADAASDFIAKWQGVTASELSTSQSFLTGLCQLLGVPVPHPKTLEQIAARFKGKGPWKKRLPGLLQMLVALERAREEGEGFVVG